VDIVDSSEEEEEDDEERLAEVSHHPAGIKLLQASNTCIGRRWVRR
jgi:hypothetical protein